MLKAGNARSLADAQLRIAREYGFPSWPKLKALVDSLKEAGQLKDAIDRNDLPVVQSMMLRNRALHEAPLGYGKDGPLTWVAECRVPYVKTCLISKGVTASRLSSTGFGQSKPIAENATELG